MNTTEAGAVNTLLRHLIDDNVSADKALAAAGYLADRAHAQLKTGLTRQIVTNSWPRPDPRTPETQPPDQPTASQNTNPAEDGGR